MGGLTIKLAAVSLLAAGMALNVPASAHETKNVRFIDIAVLLDEAKSMDADVVTNKCFNLPHMASNEYVTLVKQGFEEKEKRYTLTYEVEIGIPYFCLTKNQ